MKILSCKINHMKNPLGFGMERVSASWIADSGQSKKQAAAQVRVTKDAAMEELVFDTGKSDVLESTAVVLSVDLKPRTRYYWTVQVWGDAGDTAVSGVNWFETGKMGEQWQGKWITTPWMESEKDREIHPYFRKQFCTSSVHSARLYISGAGMYHLEINGKKVGQEYLSPGCNALDCWVQVQTYDITEYLQDGENVLGILMGDGWSKGRFGVFSSECSPYVSEFLLCAELRILHEDGTETVIGTDREWKCYPSPVLSDGIYDGEVYDARKEIEGWSEAGLDECEWEQAVVTEPQGLGNFTDRLSLPITVNELLAPQGIIETPAGETVLDMGQNMVGWLRCRIREPEGAEIKIQYGEILQNGNFYRENLRSARAEYRFISDGEEHIIEPHFTYYGFRYVKIEGLSGKPDIGDFTGCVVYSAMEMTGKLRTSDPLLNRLFENALWSQKGNFVDVPTDCPQRDERMGWTADAQVFCKTASFNMDTYAFYTKYLYDLWKEQEKRGGMVGNVVPSMIPGNKGESSAVYGGAAAWGDAAVLMPWVLYQHYGDPEILRAQYGSMKAWVEWIYAKDEASGGKRLWCGGFQYGDWLALDGPVEGGTEGGTDKDLIASAYYKISAELLARTAEILGKKEDAEKYSGLSQEIRKAVQNEFYTKSGRCAVPTQTAHILALAFDLVEEQAKQKTARELIKLLEKNGMHLQTGFVGTPLLCMVLSENGYSEAAYQVLLKEDYPGWLYGVKMGATTVWERWNSVMPDGTLSGTGMNSLNHYAYGSVVQWMYEHMCGIQCLLPGYQKFRIAPELYERLNGAVAEFDSPKGRIKAGWKVTGDRQVRVKVRVPFDTMALIGIPSGAGQEMELEAGEYEFDFELEKDHVPGYSLDDTLDTLMENPAAGAVVGGLKMLLDRIPADMVPDRGISVRKMVAGLSPMIQKMLSAQIDMEKIERELKEIKPEYRSVEIVL